jgi:hypothetical protein
MRTLLDYENAELDLFEGNGITIEGAVLWTLLASIYEDELIEEPHHRETIISNIERHKEQLLVNILGSRSIEYRFVGVRDHTGGFGKFEHLLLHPSDYARIPE